MSKAEEDRSGSPGIREIEDCSSHADIVGRHCAVDRWCASWMWRIRNSGFPCRVLSLLVMLAGLLGWQAPAHAQAFPARPVRIVVPFSPGAAVDILARTIATGLSAQWNVPVIVDNRPGGATIPGAEVVVRAEPDGHTLLFTVDDTFTIVPHLSKNTTFTPLKDLVPINLSAKILMVIVASGSLPADSIQSLISRARSGSLGPLTYSSSGNGSSTHLAMETLKSMAKIDILHVPYKGVAPALTAAASGEVQLTMTGYGTARGLIDAGRLKPLAVASPERVAGLPNVPSTTEIGMANVDATVWLGLAGPARMPSELVAQIHAAVSRVLNAPDTHKQLTEARGLVVADVGPNEFADQLQRKSSLNAEAVRRSGAKQD